MMASWLASVWLTCASYAPAGSSTSFGGKSWPGGVGTDVMRSSRARIDVSCASRDRKSTRLNSSHQIISYAVFCLKKKKTLDLAAGAALLRLRGAAIAPAHRTHTC